MLTFTRWHGQCELCQYQYKVTCAPWARALNHEAVRNPAHSSLLALIA
jgi:hypothetical protein